MSPSPVLFMASPAKSAAPTAPAKDPGIAALISAAGFIILQAPGLGYFYLGQMKKGAIYTIGFWALEFIFMIACVAIALFTMGAGFLCLVPVGLILFALGVAIVCDVYKTAKGEKGILPNF